MLATLRTSLFGEEGAAEGFTGLFGLGGKDESPASCCTATPTKSKPCIWRCRPVNNRFRT